MFDETQKGFRSVHIHPLASEHENQILEKLKFSDNWIEGTKVWHELVNNDVRFFFDFPDQESKVINDAWECEIKSVISFVTGGR